MADVRSSLDGRLLRAAKELENRFTTDLAVHESAAVAAALLSTLGTSLGRRARSVIGEVAITRQRDVSECGVYFYDYEYTRSDGSVGFGRDYFIVPTEILLGVAGFQKGAPSS